MAGRSPSQAEPRRPGSKGSGVTASAFRGVPWFSDVLPQSVAHCVRTPHYDGTKPGLPELRNRYGRSFGSNRRGREPSDGRRLATAVVVRHGRCKASSRQSDLSAAESHSSSETADPEGLPNRKWRGSR
jgi:hypothetical protein